MRGTKLPKNPNITTPTAGIEKQNYKDNFTSKTNSHLK
jgi:hypothetical protein